MIIGSLGLILSDIHLRNAEHPLCIGMGPRTQEIKGLNHGNAIFLLSSGSDQHVSTKYKRERR